MGTIQLDSQMPQRFGLSYMAPTTRSTRPMSSTRAARLARALHRDLIEHFAGAFPFWLAPCRSGSCRSAKAIAWPPGVGGEARAYRVEVDASDETVGKRIRNGEVDKIPFVVVYGDKESDESLAIRDTAAGSRYAPCWISARTLLRFSPGKQGRNRLSPPDHGLGGSTERVETSPPLHVSGFLFRRRTLRAW